MSQTDDLETAIHDMMNLLYNQHDYSKRDLFALVRSAVGRAQTGMEPGESTEVDTVTVYDVDPDNVKEQGGILCHEHMQKQYGSLNPDDAFVLEREAEADSNPCALCR